MKALYILGKEKIEFRTDVPIPEIQDGEALIRIQYAGICGSDANQYRNGPRDNKVLILGHEFAGYVVASKDDGNVRYKLGDYVTAITFDACGTCDACLNGRPSICNSICNCGFGKDGTYAEYVKVRCKNIFPFEPSVPPHVAAIAEPLSIAIFDLAKSEFRAGQSVLVSGGGPIGGLIALMAVYGGAKTIVVSEINVNRHAFLRSLGCEVYNPLEEPLSVALALNDDHPFDVAFEVAGPQSSYDLVFSAVKNGGNIVTVAPPAQPRLIDTSLSLRRQIKIIGVNLCDPIYFADAVNLINSGKLTKQLASFITDIYPLDKAETAYLASMDPKGHHIKILLDCSSDHSMPQS